MSKLNEWLYTEIDIPKSLRELHGERTRISTLVLVYKAALVCAGVVIWQLLRLEVPPWKAALGGLIFLDIGGGVVANFSASTRRYYREHEKLRIPFLLLHVVHPLALAALFPAELPYFLFAMGFTIAAGLVVNALRDAELQRNAAALLVVAGCAISFAFPLSLQILYLFAPLFLIKLVLGFAVRAE